jgi:hypothetical protein
MQHSNNTYSVIAGTTKEKLSSHNFSGSCSLTVQLAMFTFSTISRHNCACFFKKVFVTGHKQMLPVKTLPSHHTSLSCVIALHICSSWTCARSIYCKEPAHSLFIFISILPILQHRYIMSLHSQKGKSLL